jgi:hypothetical protein
MRHKKARAASINVRQATRPVRKCNQHFMDECPARLIDEIAVVVESGMRQKDHYFGPIGFHDLSSKD